MECKVRISVFALGKMWSEKRTKNLAKPNIRYIDWSNTYNTHTEHVVHHAMPPPAFLGGGETLNTKYVKAEALSLLWQCVPACECVCECKDLMD